MLDRELSKGYFHREDIPTLWCPKCWNGHISLKQNSIKEFEPNYSKIGRENENWEPEQTTNRFSAILCCNKNGCGEVVVASGNICYVEVENESRWGNIELLEPKVIVPTPHFFQIPSSTPLAVIDLLEASFSVFWLDKNASMNKVRIAVEQILDSQEIQRTSIDKNGKESRVGLHHRISKFKNINPEAAESLMAVKEVGNLGSHEYREISTEIAIVVYDLIYFSLIQMYGGVNEELKKKRKMLIESKGRKNR